MIILIYTTKNYRSQYNAFRLHPPSSMQSRIPNITTTPTTSNPVLALVVLVVKFKNIYTELLTIDGDTDSMSMDTTTEKFLPNGAIAVLYN